MKLNPDALEDLYEALDDAIATLLAVRATASSEDWAGAASHFFDVCGETIKNANAALRKAQGNDQ